MVKKVKYKSLLSGRELVIITIFFLVVLLVGYFTFFTPNYYNLQAPVTFEVKKGESFSHISNRLYNAHIIPGKLNFKIVYFRESLGFPFQGYTQRQVNRPVGAYFWGQRSHSLPRWGYTMGYLNRPVWAFVNIRFWNF